MEMRSGRIGAAVEILTVAGGLGNRGQPSGNRKPLKLREIMARESMSSDPRVDKSAVEARDSLPLPILVDGEARIRDLDLAARLGFEKPHKIRDLIVRHREALKNLGVFSTVQETAGNKGGRPGRPYYLNRRQAIFITAKSETPTATEITIEIVERFDAYERGSMDSTTSPVNMRDPAQLAQAAMQLVEINMELGSIC